MTKRQITSAELHEFRRAVRERVIAPLRARRAEQRAAADIARKRYVLSESSGQ